MSAVVPVIARLSKFTACDVSDGLLKLGISNGGYLPDIVRRSRQDKKERSVVIGRAWTVKFVPKQSSEKPDFTGHYIDQVPPSVSVHGKTLDAWPVVPVLGAPESFNCAVLGGIMALQASQRQAAAIVVSGRVRDLDEINALADVTPVFSRGLSTVGAGAESKVVSIGTDCEVTGYGIVKTGDVVFIDDNGIVVIPAQIDLEQLLTIMTTSTSQDEQVKESVKHGMTVQEAFKKWRT